MAVVAACAAACEGITPTLPLEAGDCMAVFQRLRPAVPKPYELDVYHDGREIRVEVQLEHEVVFERVLRP